MEKDCEAGETVTESFIQQTSPIHKRFQIVENSLCFKISKHKFNCIMLFLVIVLTFLQIVKLALPTMEPEDMKILTHTLTRTFKRVNTFLKLNLTSTTELPDLLPSTTTLSSLEYD